MDSNEKLVRNSTKVVVYCFERILEAAQSKRTVVRLLTAHLVNQKRNMSKTYGTLIGKEDEMEGNVLFRTPALDALVLVNQQNLIFVSSV